MDAAVLVPLYRDRSGALRLVLLRRTEGGTHGGQIALPGGKLDPADASPRDAALREAYEEIGLPPASVEMLEELPILETRTTGFRIYPFLARITPPPEWVLAEREVAEVLDVSLADLVDPSARGSSMERFASRPEPVRIEFIRIGPHRLWGATHRILAPVLPRIAAGEWPI